MLSKEHRLAKTKDVKSAIQTGRSFFNPYFTLKHKKSRGAAPRFTVVVSTKVSKKAVARNKIKRVLREEIRLRLSQFPVGDYAVLVKPKAAQLDVIALREQFLRLIVIITRKG